MKTLAIWIFALFTAFPLPAQAEYEKADSVAKAFQEKYTDAADLAQKLTQPFSDERDKARAIFAWISFNIRYDYKKYKDPPPRPRIVGNSRQELEKSLRELQENEIRNTLRNKKGVCADYSRLFHRMCQSVGLESAVVTGVSRKPSGRAGGSHAWNAIKIGGKWQLLDVTWGAGYIDNEDEHFVRRYTPAYFFTPPSLFILNHLPADDKWQLLDKPLSKKEFSKQPKVYFSSPDFPLEAFSPADGKIATTDGKAEVRLKFSKMPEVLGVFTGKTRYIPAQVEKTGDGWAVLTFSPGRASEVSIFAGNNKRKTWTLAEFSVE